LPPSGPGLGGIRIPGSRAVHRVSGAVVRSINSVFFPFFFVNVPITSNWTGFVVTDVLEAAGRGVKVGVGVFFLDVGVGLGVFTGGVIVAVGVGLGTNVGDGGAPVETMRD